MSDCTTSGLSIYEISPLIEISASSLNENQENYHDKIHQLNHVFGIDLTLNRTPLRAVLLAQQFIEARWALVFDKNKDYVLQSAYLKPESLLKSILEKDTDETKKLDDDYIYFVAYNHDYANYYHWTIQCLPSLILYFSLKNIYANLKILLPADIPEFAAQYLSSLNIDAKEEVEFLSHGDKLFFADKIVYPSVLGGEFSFNTSETLLSFGNANFERFLKNGLPSFNLFSKNKSKILYCSRLDSPYRKITNEGALVDVLKNKYDARIFVSTGQSIKEQARKFYEAEIIISPHGAGMSNVIYCRSNTVIIELIPDKYINPCFATLALNKGCRYYPNVFPTKVFEGHQHDYEWEVDISAIETMLTKIIQA